MREKCSARVTVKNMTPEKQQPRRVTAGDVAARAGVSNSTVSKALSGNGNVRFETRQHILEVARELGFQTRQDRTDTIGVITSDRFGRLTSPVLLGAIEALAEREVALQVYDGRGDPIREQHFIDSLIRRHVDGILVTGSGEFSRDPIRKEVPIPIVYAMAWSRAATDASVVPDDYTGAKLAAEHVLATGRRKIVFISGTAHDDASRTRLSAVEETLASQGLKLVAEPLFGSWSEKWGRQAINQLLNSKVDFDGVVCGSDQVARGVTDGLRENEVSVPGSVGVIGFDNWDVMVEASRPPLSTIDMNLNQVGDVAARLLLQAIDEGVLEPGIRYVDCRMIPRESTAIV